MGLRTEIAGALEDEGLVTATYLPERVTPPIAIISPSDPYVENGQVYGEYLASFEVLLVAGKASNIVETDALDTMIEKAISALPQFFDSCSSPILLEVNNAQFLSAQVKVSIPFDMSGGS